MALALGCEQVFEFFSAALNGAQQCESPYRHWIINNLFSNKIIEDLQSLSFPVASPGDLSGKRELHNDTRHYFDQQNIGRYPVVAGVAEAFQAPCMAKRLADFTGAKLDDTFLRIEYAQDVTGFWLEPHTDLGVKRITILIYLSDAAGQSDLGTDIFDASKNWANRTPFAPNTAMMFVPGNDTFHGFVQRPIEGVRKSLILNYVTDEWRDREQLAFPNNPVRL